MQKHPSSSPNAYRLAEEKEASKQSPIIVSCPHVGLEIPDDFRALMDPETAGSLPDTDWYVHDLYDFAPSLGVPVLSAVFSRYVIDLNRDPHNKPLYADGRVETGLYPQDTFHSKPLFKPSVSQSLLDTIRQRSFDQIYTPYHQQLRLLLEQKKRSFNPILLWEAHSIHRTVPRIQKEPFADIMIGDALGTTCAAEITEILRSTLAPSFETVTNRPFKGGYITRHYAKREEGVMTVQIEMSQDLYLTQREGGFPAISSEALRLKQALQKAMEEVREYLLSNNRKA